MPAWPTLALLVLLFESPDDGGLRSSPEQRLMFAKQSAEVYRFHLPEAASRKVTLRPEPLLRWDNKVIREDDGLLFLWTEGDKGRPVAAAQFFLVDTTWHHEFQSVIDEPVQARDSDADWNWGPTKAGIRWQNADDMPTVNDSAAQRLRDMKKFVAQFTAAVDVNAAFDSAEQLRLLTTPLYRYSSPEDGILDGAMFAFVQGTNPEIMISIEAVARSTSKDAWRYAFARMSCFNLRVYRDGNTVWSQDRAPVPTPERTSPYFFRLSARTDKSAKIVIPTDAARGRP